MDEFAADSEEEEEEAAAEGDALPRLERSPTGRHLLARSYELGPGCVAGSTDFYLARPHLTQAVCSSPLARVLRLSRTAMQRMASESPQALNVLQMIVMRANTLDLAAAAAMSKHSLG